MENIVAEAILCHGVRNFEKIYSPAYGDVDLVDIKKTGKNSYIIHVNDGRSIYSFDGNGRLSNDGEMMIFPQKGDNSSAWEKYINPIDSAIYKMKETPRFSQEEIEAVEYLKDTNRHSRTLGDYMTNKKKEEIIKDAIEEIDFDRIKNIMEFDDWTYYDGRPTATRLRNLCRELLENVLSQTDKTDWFNSTGGFTVGFRVFEPEDGEADIFENCVRVYVRFTLEEFDTMI